MTEFRTLPADDREEWRASPVTEAFYAAVMADRTREVINLVDAVKSVGADRIEHIGGKLAAYDEILALIMRK
jgi:hypothetical protein